MTSIRSKATAATGASAAAPAMAGPSVAGVRAVAGPALSHRGVLTFAFDEDALTLAHDALRAAAVAAGARIAVAGVGLPKWFVHGTGLALDEASPLRLSLLATEAGPLAVVHDAGSGELPVAALADQCLHRARALDDETAERLAQAREGPDTEADYPLGAHVVPTRHDAVLVERLRLGAGAVATWTTIGAGAAPTEFHRLQQALGAYHVALIDLDAGGRTVGLWVPEGTGAAPRTEQRCVPVLRRLLRQQGAWRHGVKFAPLTA